MKPAKVVGLDLSLTSTGAAWEPDACRRIQTRPKDWATEDDRLEFIVLRVMEIVHDAHDPDRAAGLLVVIEGLSYGQASGSAFTRAGLHYLVRRAVLDAGHRFVVVAPTALKKFVTGNGNASKELMVSTMARRLGRSISSDDVADAYGLLAIGQALEGTDESLIGTITKAQQQVLTKIREAMP